jgi:hypothetical protein
MHSRCSNQRRPDFKNYGARGIKVCDAWKTFERFLSDMGEMPDGMSLDRIDIEDNYDPSNCRWVSLNEQSHNRRDTVWVVLHGKSMSAKSAANKLAIPYERVRWAVARYGGDWFLYATSPNAGSIQSNNSTGVRGVSFHKASGRYHARIQRNGKVESLGYFGTVEEAAIVRAAAAIGEMK